MANRFRVLVFLVALVALIVLETWVLAVLGLPSDQRWYLTGFLHAVVAACVLGGIGVSFLVHEREAVWKVRGAWGEDFTREELARARRKRLIWGWVDSVTVQNGDIDHLVVTKAGGLVAIDSKWRSGADQLDPAAMASEANRATLRARGVVHTSLGAARGARRAPVRSTDVTPLIVVWGPARDAVPEGARVDGVDFVPGEGLLDWLRKLDGDTVDEDAAADLLVQLEEYRSTAWSPATKRKRAQKPR